MHVVHARCLRPRNAKKVRVGQMGSSGSKTWARWQAPCNPRNKMAQGGVAGVCVATRTLQSAVFLSDMEDQTKNGVP